MMNQMWEYRTVQSWKQAGQLPWATGLDRFLNDFGAQGWELVSVLERERNGVEWIFKRARGAATVMTERTATSADARWWG